jgi:hypothetical protein
VPPSHFQPPRAIRDRGARRPHRGGGSPLPGTAQPEPLHRRLTAPAQGLARLVLRMQARDPQGGEPDGRPAALRHPVAALAVQHDLPGRGARPH